MRFILNYINNGFEWNESMNVYTILMNSLVIRARFNPEIFSIVYQVRSSTNKTLQVLTFLVLLQDRYQAFYAMHIHQE